MNLWTVFGKHYRDRKNTQCDSKNIRIKRRLLDSRYYLSSLIRHKIQQFCSKHRPIFLSFKTKPGFHKIALIYSLNPFQSINQSMHTIHQPIYKQLIPWDNPLHQWVGTVRECRAVFTNGTVHKSKMLK